MFLMLVKMRENVKLLLFVFLNQNFYKYLLNLFRQKQHLI